MAGNASTAILTFTMTPELERVRARGRLLHPTFPDDVQMAPDMYGIAVPAHAENMNLPDLDDKRGILKYLGLNDSMIDWVLEKYHAEFSTDPEELAVKNDITYGETTSESFRYPLLDRLDSIVTHRDVPEIHELDINYDDYVRGGLAEGLRPEFAIFCGLHSSEPGYQREAYRDYFYTKGYQEHADDIIMSCSASLSRLWDDKFRFEKAKRQAEAQSSTAAVENVDSATSDAVREVT
ncbi:hypothetical protein GGR52DRAFT_551132 [Hypoxylon sp. FL1284]|nr:hypothetical protein GGR52DRAFT_551132 [Hypoxylon sp. FL1284]